MEEALSTSIQSVFIPITREVTAQVVVPGGGWGVWWGVESEVDSEATVWEEDMAVGVEVGDHSDNSAELV